MTTDATKKFIASMEQRYGTSRKIGRGNIFDFGGRIVLAISNSKLHSDNSYFYAIQEEFLQWNVPPRSKSRFYAALVSSDGNIVVFIPHSLLLELFPDPLKNRASIILRGGKFLLRAHGQSLTDITQYVNAFPLDEIAQQDKTAPAAKQIEAVEPVEQQQEAINEHTRIQWMLVRFGQAEGREVWVPANDRGKNFNGENFVDLTLGALPNFGFDTNTRQIIANIDVLWLRENVIYKAFEIESTTAIYSGFLRMSDLVLSQPNVSIDLNLVAPLRRREIVRKNILRPTFARLRPKCSYISFEEITGKYDMAKALLSKQTRIQDLLEGENF